MSDRIEVLAGWLITLYEQEAETGKVDAEILAHVQAADLSDAELWDVMVNHWPHDGSLHELSLAIEWLQDSPIWRANVPTSVLTKRRRLRAAR